MKVHNWQDFFLSHIKNENIYVQIYLTNGFQLKGLVVGFDNFTVMLEDDGKQTLIYKHAISTITPAKIIEITKFNDLI